jgi:DNA-binding transcriptional ArsR family regulator
MNPVYQPSSIYPQNHQALGDRLPETLRNDGSGISTLSFQGGIFSSQIGSKVSLFRNDEFIEKLNQLLRYELGAVGTYCRLVHKCIESDLSQELITAHQKASRELCCIIISHHGLPDKEPAPIFKVTGTMIDLLTQLSLSPKILLLSLSNFEQHMSRRYGNLIVVAPEQDRHALIELKRLCRKNRSLLRKSLRAR